MNIHTIVSYLPPEGEFEGTILMARLNKETKNDLTRESIRLTIGLDAITEDSSFDYRVRADFYNPKEFMLYAKMQLGGLAKCLINSEGDVVEEHLSILDGHRVSFGVTHHRKGKHQEAYRKVVDIRPAKTDTSKCSIAGKL